MLSGGYFKKIALITFSFMMLSIHSGGLIALSFPLPKTGDIIGDIQFVKALEGESLGELGRRYDIGFYEMMEANPDLDPWLPAPNSVVLIPTQFILPQGPRQGIVLNLAEMRLYYYHSDKPLVTTFPIGIGKKGAPTEKGVWSTPLGQTKVIRKKKGPSWTPPKGIREEHLKRGDILPLVVPAGPENPLGRYALYLGFKEVLFHGSPRTGGVGVRSSHGCIRLLPEDIESLYYMVPTGTEVRIIHEPFKVGWHKNRLYLEAHQPLTEPQYVGSDSLDNLSKAIESVVKERHAVNFATAKMVAKHPSGYPVRID